MSPPLSITGVSPPSAKLTAADLSVPEPELLRVLCPLTAALFRFSFALEIFTPPFVQEDLFTRDSRRLFLPVKPVSLSYVVSPLATSLKDASSAHVTTIPPLPFFSPRILEEFSR